MKTSISAILFFILCNSCISQVSKFIEFKIPDSLSVLKTNYQEENIKLKAEIRKLNKQENTEKILLLIVAGVIGFTFTRINKYYENKSKIKMQFKTHYEFFKKEIVKFNLKYSILANSFYKPEKPKSINELYEFFKHIKEYYGNVSNFTYGEYNSPDTILIRDYFTDESFSQLYEIALKSIEYFNYLNISKIDKNNETIENILLKMQLKSDDIF